MLLTTHEIKILYGHSALSLLSSNIVLSTLLFEEVMGHKRSYFVVLEDLFVTLTEIKKQTQVTTISLLSKSQQDQILAQRASFSGHCVSLSIP